MFLLKLNNGVFTSRQILRHDLRRLFFTGERRTRQLEADVDMNPTNTLKQCQLFAHLLKNGNNHDIIQRFESDALLQRAPDLVKIYVTACARENEIGKITNIISSRQDLDIQDQSPPLQSRIASVGPSTLHRIQTDRSKWQRPLASQRTGNMDPNDPISVVITEAFSWSKLLRKLGAKALYSVLILTGLAVLLDQQGIIKSGVGNMEFAAHAATGDSKVGFADVEGVDEAKQDLEEVVLFLKEPKRFMDVGGRLPKGVLLHGPPGTGKTLLARAVAGEAGVPFYQLSGSEFDEMYVGVGARRVRELFAKARSNAPCIVFIDEIDAVGSKRSSKDQSYMRQTLNQLLVELDGFKEFEGVVFIAATNTVEVLDKALIRPGRFDHHVHVPLPDVHGRKKILEVHSKNVKMSPSIEVSTIARGTPGFSGADLANLINQAALHASKSGAKQVRLSDMEWAKDKIMMGSERKSAVITEANKRLTAYHEGGHALVALYTAGAMPLHKVTVIPRGNALGLTMQLPEEDVTGYTRKQLLARLDVCMGGRVAEELMFGSDEVTTGASSDLQQASNVAKGMVIHYGMSPKVGLVSHSQDELNKLSSEQKMVIEGEVRTLLDEANLRATNLLKKHKNELDLLAKALIEYETLGVDEIKKVIKGDVLNRVI